MMSIHQEITLQASPQRIYDALTDAQQFSALSGATAEIDPVPGGHFSCFDGMITGMTIEAIPGRMLVQAWRVGNWEAGTYSIVKFVIEKTNNEAAVLVFDHTGFPEEHREHLSHGWNERYWEPLKKYLAT